MKLLIKKKYFDEIKSGMKESDFRDAHITFICEETGETLFKRITDVCLTSRERVPERYRDILKDDYVIEFEW
jgi:hypothetical protein